MALSATLTADDDDFRVEFVNEDDEPVRFSTATMVGSAAFQLHDDAGRPVPLGPPPMPPADLTAGMVELTPGASTALIFRRAELLPDGLPPGRHHLRFAADAPAVEGAWSGHVESPWIALR